MIDIQALADLIQLTREGVADPEPPHRRSATDAEIDRAVAEVFRGQFPGAGRKLTIEDLKGTEEGGVIES